MVIAELPGSSKDSVHLAVTRDQLMIKADGGVSQYHTTASLLPVVPGSMKSSI
jgi:HSP20 family molecular chaperone IbpA